MKSKTSVSSHQVGVMTALLFVTLKLSSFPSLLYRFSGNNSIWVFLGFILINFVFIGLIIWIKSRHPDKSLYDIFKDIFGVVLTKIIYILLFAFFIFKLLSLCSDGYTFIKETCHKGLALAVFLVCFLPVITSMAYSGIRNIARTCEFFYPILIIFVVVILVFSSVPIYSLSSKLVIEFNVPIIFDSVFNLAFWMGDIFAILIILDKIDLKKQKLGQLFSPLVITSILIFLLYVIYFALYTRTSDFYTNAILDILQYAVSTTDGWHMDILSILVYMISILLEGAIFMYVAKESISKALHYKYSKVTYFAILCLLISIEFLYLNDYLAYVDFAKNILHYFVFGLIVLLLILFIAILKKEKNHGKRT